MSFEGFANKKIFKPGEIIGVNELMFGLNWQTNIIGRVQGQFLKIKKEGIQDIFDIAPKSGINILINLVRYQSIKIRNKAVKRK